MTLAPILEAADAVERAWRGCGYEEEAFPGLCVERLQAARLCDRVKADDVIRWVLAADLPPQLNPRSDFGQPPITVFRGRRFVVDVLFWVDGTTSIHDHGFSGAFQVLSGSSIETTFTWECSRALDARMQFGKLAPQGSTLLSEGEVRPILAGPRFIHSLFHLDRPTVSLVIRTFRDPVRRIQMRYYPSGLAHDTYHEDETQERQVRLVEMLRVTEDPSFADHLGDLLEKADRHTSLALMETCARVSDTRLQESLIDRVRDPELADHFRDWLGVERRLRLLRRARSNVREPTLRFLLAVLLNTHGRADAFKLVSSYAPNAEPARQIAAWLRELSLVTIPLQVGKVPWEPSVLGLPVFEDGFEDLLASELRGQTAPRSDAEQRFMNRLRALPVLSPLFA